MNLIRFSAYAGDQMVAQTPWTPETGPTSATNLLATFRKEHPNYAYRIEREGDSKVPNLRPLTRVTIKDGTDLYYSRAFEAHEVDEQLAKIREQWPTADITTETRNG